MTKGGFDFSNVLRNKHIEANSHKAGGSSSSLPKATSTGTTIVGCIFDDGVVIGADTRATEGEIIADKNCEKIHYISDNIKCAGAGTAADTEFTTAMISSNIQLHALSTGKPPRVVTAMTMLKQYLFRYQGHVGAALVLGGYDVTGPQLFTIAPHGSTDKLPYVTMGSGSLAAMATFETGWKAGLTRDQAIELVCEAIEAGIWNDLGSGSNVDVCVVEKDKSQMMRNYRTPNVRSSKQLRYTPKPGSTAIKKTDVWSLVEDTQVIDTSISPQPAGTAGGMDIDS